MKPYAESEQASLREQFGSRRFDEKFKRWLGIDYPPIGLIDEYPGKIAEIINCYSMGDWYPAVVSSCCLAERILNRLVLQCRAHFRSHPKYKLVARQNSFNDWDRMLDVIHSWQLIPQRALDLLEELRPVRHQTIHYNEGYDFEAIAPRVVSQLVAAVSETFGVLNRKDIYLVFDVPGEVWVRSDAEKLPFVREFVFPHCYRAHAVHEIDTAKKRIVERLGRVGPLSDEEFVELRRESQKPRTGDA
ncbi:MAG: hypothetical protein WC815_17045 [Vicinamibacterales bacterium]